MKVELFLADGQRGRQADMGKASLRFRSAKVPDRADLILSRVKRILIAKKAEHVVIFHQIN